MLARPHHRWTRLLAALLLAVYGAFGLAGYGLHGLLPCHDAACHGHGEHGCCCDHDAHAAPPQIELAVAFRSADDGHDAATCSLCSVLAKINVGYAAQQLDVVRAEPACDVTTSVDSLLPADLALAASARGPPIA
jgi:hypothetical protein